MGGKKNCLIVGSGIAGLASAIRLARLGFAVQVFEKNAYPGGKLTSFRMGDFHFDAGPSLFTMPHLVDELLTETNFIYQRSDTACHYFFEDGTFLKFPAKIDELIPQVCEQLNIDPAPLRKHFERSAFIYEKTHAVFMERSLHRFHFSKELIKAIVAIPKLHLFDTMHNVNERQLNHPKLVQIFDRFATYNGSDPYQAPGILNIIPHLEHGLGTFFPEKGMRSITNSLVAEAKMLGVDFHLNENVEEIVSENGECKGIIAGKKFHAADVVICNADIKAAYKHLLKDLRVNKKTLKQEPSSSALIFYWGIKAEFKELDLHNILFSAEYKAEFDAIFKENTVSNDPTVYIHVSSKMVRSDAPAGCENWFVMINVPSDSGQDWEALRIKTREIIIRKINRILGIDLESLIVEENYLDPPRIEERTSSFGGALYGASSNERMAAFFRHPNFSKLKGLYFAGGSVHPGGGIPLCLFSAKITAELVAQDFSIDR